MNLVRQRKIAAVLLKDTLAANSEVSLAFVLFVWALYTKIYAKMNLCLKAICWEMIRAGRAYMLHALQNFRYKSILPRYGSFTEGGH